MPVLGGPGMGHQVFVETAGRSAEGVVFPLLWLPDDAGRRRVTRSASCGEITGETEHVPPLPLPTADGRSAVFARRFQQRFGSEPDYTAAHAYDAVNLLIAAIHRAGLNRAGIRDAVRELSPWSGVTGTITWDPTGHNDRPVHMGTIRNGRIILLGQSPGK